MPLEADARDATNTAQTESFQQQPLAQLCGLVAHALRVFRHASMGKFNFLRKNEEAAYLVGLMQ